jgi:hypothetical protein
VRATRGSTVILRDIYWGAPWFAWPLAVEEDGERGLLAWLLPGAIGQVPSGYPSDRGRVLAQLRARSCRHAEHAWQDTARLHVLVPDQWWTASLMWDASDMSFLCWYVDMRLPINQTRDFIDSRDLQLDLVVGGDGRWAWKDEDDLALMTTMGVIDEDTAAHIAAARGDLIAAVESRRFPFNDELLELRPSGLLPPVLGPHWYTGP